MKKRIKTIILIAQIFAIVIFILSYKSYINETVKPIQVYSFARTIGEGVKITEKDLIKSEVSKNSYTPNMILLSELDSVLGKYTTTKVFKDTNCYKEQFGDLNKTEKDFTSLDLSNARLMSIPVDMVNDVGGFLEEGDKIDLLFSGAGTSSIVNINQNNNDSTNNQSSNNSSSTDESFYYSKLFMPNLTVYKVLNGNGYKYAQRATRYEGESSENLDISNPQEVNVDSSTIKSIILIVTPEQAEEIKVRSKVGNVNILKRFDESETHDTLGYVLGNYGKVFSGNANAETGSLQIISTIQDTDNNKDELLNSNETNSETKNDTIVTQANSNNKETQQNNNESSEKQENIGAVIGGSSVE